MMYVLLRNFFIIKFFFIYLSKGKISSKIENNISIPQIILLEKHGDKIGSKVNGNLYYLKSIVFHEGKSIENGHYKSKI